VVEIIRDNRRDIWIEIHHVRLVKYGDSHHMDCDLTLPWYMNIADAHTESDRLKELITSNYSSKIDLTVHTDACFQALCQNCRIKDCFARKEEFRKDLDWSLEKMIERDPQVKRGK